MFLCKPYEEGCVLMFNVEVLSLFEKLLRNGNVSYTSSATISNILQYVCDVSNAFSPGFDIFWGKPSSYTQHPPEYKEKSSIIMDGEQRKTLQKHLHSMFPNTEKVVVFESSQAWQVWVITAILLLMLSWQWYGRDGCDCLRRTCFRGCWQQIADTHEILIRSVLLSYFLNSIREFWKC